MFRCRKEQRALTQLHRVSRDQPARGQLRFVRDCSFILFIEQVEQQRIACPDPIAATELMLLDRDAIHEGTVERGAVDQLELPVDSEDRTVMARYRKVGQADRFAGSRPIRVSPSERTKSDPSAGPAIAISLGFTSSRFLKHWQN